VKSLRHSSGSGAAARPALCKAAQRSGSGAQLGAGRSEGLGQALGLVHGTAAQHDITRMQKCASTALTDMLCRPSTDQERACRQRCAVTDSRWSASIGTTACAAQLAASLALADPSTAHSTRIASTLARARELAGSVW